MALVVGLVLLWRRTGVGAEWIIGAGASFVLLNYGGLVDFLRREDTSLDTTAMVMRTIAAALTVVAVVIAWRLAEVPGPRINLVMGVVLVVAAIVALTGIRDYGDHVDLKVRSWLIIALIVLLLVRGLAFAPRTTGAPALVAGDWSAPWPASSPARESNGTRGSGRRSSWPPSASPSWP